MNKKITLDLPVDLIADIEVAKENSKNLEDLLIRYPHTITGEVQRILIQNNSKLLSKISSGLKAAKSKRL